MDDVRCLVVFSRATCFLLHMVYISFRPKHFSKWLNSPLWTHFLLLTRQSSKFVAPLLLQFEFLSLNDLWFCLFCELYFSDVRMANLVLFLRFRRVVECLVHVVMYGIGYGICYSSFSFCRVRSVFQLRITIRFGHICG